MKEQFLKPKLLPSNMLTYTARKALLNAVIKAGSKFNGDVLDVGCGIMPYKQIITSNPDVTKYIGLDISEGYHTSFKPDMVWDGKTIPLEDKSVDGVFATEFFEHYHDTNQALKEVNRVLTNQGLLFGTVPFIWCLHEVPYDEYRFTPYSLRQHLEAAEFQDIEIFPLGGFDYAFAQFMGLWLTHRVKNRLLRGVLRYLLFPFYALLIKNDIKPKAFDNNVMYSGLYFFARKK